MSSLIPPIGSHLPTIQIVARAAAPIAIDYIVTRFLQAPRAAVIPALGTLVLANRHVTTLEQVADSLLYFAYKALHSLFFSRKKNKETYDSSNTVSYWLIYDASSEDLLSTTSNFEKLQAKFKEFLPTITWTAGSSFDKIDPSEIRKRWDEQNVTQKATALFALAVKDSGDLYDELTMAAMGSNKPDRYKKMAELLTTQPYYERLCDPSKSSILFLYHLARGYGYYTRVGGAYYPHSLPLDKSEMQPFYQDNTAQSNWRNIYNQQVAQWANILKHLPADSIVRQCAMTDTQKTPLQLIFFRDNFLIGS